MNEVASPLKMDRQYLVPTMIRSSWSTIAVGIVFIVALYEAFFTQNLPNFAAYTSTIGLLIAFLFSVFITPKNFTVGYLLSLLPFVIAWRVAAMNGAVVLEVICFFVFLLLLVQLIDCIRNDWKHSQALGWFGHLMWQSTIVRMYFGLNEAGHATEKIFAGLGSYHNLVSHFVRFGTPFPHITVVLAGLVEFALAIGIGLGVLTRLSAAVGVIYFLVATIPFGGEWTHGYGWNAPGGGWEYAALVIICFASFVLSGSGKFSIDGWLMSRGCMPKVLLPFCRTKAGYQA